MKRKVILYIFLAILLFNPLSLGLFLSIIGIGLSFESGRDEEIVTFFSFATPRLPNDSLWFSSGNDSGGIQISDWQRKPMIVYDDRGNKILEIFPSDPKQNREYRITSDNRFIPTGKIFKSYSFQISQNNSWIHFPDLKIKLYNQDGSIRIGPYEDEKLYQYYAYKNGKWERYTWIVNGNTANEIAEEASLTADYYFTIPGGLYVREQEKLIANTFIVESNKQYHKKPQSFIFTHNLYYWNLNIEYGGQRYEVNFTTIKDPQDLVFYPMKL